MKTAEEEINELISKYNFEVAVLEDVNYRLSCCRDEAYARQQLRYLKNQIIMGFATEKRNTKILINEKRKIYG